MRPQRRDRGIVARQLGLGQCRMYLVMADLMQQNRRPALSTFQLGNQMMETLPRIRGDGPPAQGAYGNI